jgi:hypothetical protein
METDKDLRVRTKLMVKEYLRLLNTYTAATVSLGDDCVAVAADAIDHGAGELLARQNLSASQRKLLVKRSRARRDKMAVFFCACGREDAASFFG